MLHLKYRTENLSIPKRKKKLKETRNNNKNHLIAHHNSIKSNSYSIIYVYVVQCSNFIFFFFFCSFHDFYVAHKYCTPLLTIKMSFPRDIVVALLFAAVFFFIIRFYSIHMQLSCAW